MEESFDSFTTQEKQAVFLLLAEVCFTVCSLVTVVREPRPKNRYQPQAGTVKIVFGGNSTPNSDAFGGVKGQTSRPATTPGVRVEQNQQRPREKDKSFSF